MGFQQLWLLKRLADWLVQTGRPVTDAPLPPGLPGVDAHAPKLSFSAALTVPMETAGTIIFDKIFVNQGDLYDPKTGKLSFITTAGTRSCMTQEQKDNQ